MIKHIILWKIKDGVENPEEVKINAKRQLEALKDKIPEIEYIKVNIEGLPSSTCEMMLDSAFASVCALETYKAHPAHVAAADNFIRPFVDTRLCLDFEE